MNKESNKLFSKYLLDQLSDEEARDFESKLESDPKLKEAFQEYKMATVAGQRLHYQDIKKSVSTIIQEEKAKKRKPRLLRYILPPAAILILAIGSIMILQNNSTTPEGIYASYYEAPDYSPVRGATDTIDLKEQIKTDYTKKDYVTAIEKIEELDSSDFVLPSTQRILAQSYLGLNKPQESIAIYKNILYKEPSKSGPSDYWYLGLAFLKNQNPDSSLVYIEKLQIEHEDSFFSKKASEILRDIRKLKTVE